MRRTIGIRISPHLRGDQLAVGEGDWVAVTFNHPDGPVLAHIGQVKSWSFATSDSPSTITLSVPREPFQTVTIPLGSVETSAIADGPWLTEAEVQELLAQ